MAPSTRLAIKSVQGTPPEPRSPEPTVSQMSRKRKSPNVQIRLAPESGQTALMNARREEIQRILSFNTDSTQSRPFYDILGVREPKDNKDQVDLERWNQEVLSSLHSKGTLIHPKVTKVKNAKKAFERLLDAAERLGVFEWRLQDLRDWDGKTDLEKDFVDESENDSDCDFDADGDVPMVPVNRQVSEPTERVKEIYRDKKTSFYMQKLMHSPYDSEATMELSAISNEIWRQAPINERSMAMNWVIDIGFFGAKFQEAAQQYHKVVSGTQEEAKEAANKIAMLKMEIDKNNASRFYPSSWTLLPAEVYQDCYRISKGIENMKNTRDAAWNQAKVQVDATIQEIFKLGQMDNERGAVIYKTQDQLNMAWQEVGVHKDALERVATRITWAKTVARARGQEKVCQATCKHFDEGLSRVSTHLDTLSFLLKGGDPRRVKQETDDDSLFLSSITDTGSDDPLDIVSFTRSDENQYGDKAEGYHRGYFGRLFGVFRQGPRNAAKYNMVEVPRMRVETFAETAYGERKEYGERVAKKGQLRAFQGIAVEGGIAHLVPSNWKLQKNGVHRPPMMAILTKWETRDGLETCWEKRGAVKRCWDNGYHDGISTCSQMTAPHDVEANGKVILTKGTKIGKMDWALLQTAARCEERHSEWLNGEREGRNVSPTPAPWMQING